MRDFTTARYQTFEEAVAAQNAAEEGMTDERVTDSQSQQEGRIEKRLDELPTEGNWDTYGARGVTDEAKAAVGAFTICPTSKGGVTITWKDEAVYVEFGPDGECMGVSWEAS